MDQNSLSVDEFRFLDKKAVSLGLSERILIENASSNLFSIIDELNFGKKVLVVSGRGNNGADVLACGRKLISRGYQVQVLIIAEKELASEAFFQKQILEQLSIPVSTDSKELISFLNEADFVLEGLLGIGIRGEVPSFLEEVINTINQSGKKIVACDIPSGLSPDDGRICGAAIKADVTISFLAPKKAFSTQEGKLLCGKIFIVDIGISKELLS
ncbi:MAG: NAD(P)H-hydrate epimerase [Candidatus Omnitrophica bacterium]|nr:NAD(P)H-hydrate epimerase [Candidatus Omnitrophota bacterium]